MAVVRQGVPAGGEELVEPGADQFGPRAAEQRTHRAVDPCDRAVERHQCHADRVVLERPAEPFLALGERAEQAVVVDRDRGQVGEALDEVFLARRRLVRHGVVDGERAADAVAATDRGRPARPQAEAVGQRAVAGPAHVGADVGGDHRLPGVGRGSARSRSGADRHAVDPCRVLRWQRRRRAVPQGRGGAVEQQHRAAAVGDERLEGRGDAGQDVGERDAGGDLLEDAGLPGQQRDGVGVVEIEVEAGHGSSR